MTRFIRGLDLLKNPTEYGFKDIQNVTEICVDYKPEFGMVELLPEFTGFERRQVFSTEELEWHLVLIKNNETGEEEVTLVGNQTNDVLCLSGKPGYDYGIECMQTICRECYSNKALDIVANSINAEAWQLLPNQLRQQDNNSYWITKKNRYDYSDYSTYALYYANRFSEMQAITYISSGFSGGSAYRVRPIIYLPKNITVEIDNHEENEEMTECKLKLLIHSEKEGEKERLRNECYINAELFENYALSILKSAKEMEEKAQTMLEYIRQVKELK